MDGLSGLLRDEVPDYPDYRDHSEKDHGAQGEREFIQQLLDKTNENFFVIARLMQRPKEDVDVILIGPKGIWVFEVKHWSGEIIWDDQGWRRVQTYYERGGVEITKQPEVGKPPDEQWLRAAVQVSRTLKSHAKEVLSRYQALEHVRGGIVFTKREAVLNIQPGRPVYWGTISFWIKTLKNLAPIAELETRSALQIVESLLTRHHQLAPNHSSRSMQFSANQIVLDAEERLREWIQL